ncbi:MAG: methyl-accepting chemotaxis protein, partial [Microcystaceae cyanobacterium]
NILQSKNLKTRILLVSSVPIGILVLFGLVSGVAVQQLNSTASDLERANKVVDNLRDSVIHTSRIIRSIRGTGLFPKEEHYRASYDTGVERLDEAVAAMEGGSLIHDPQQKENWNKLVKG